MPKKLYALLVGINDYPQISTLKGCVRDIEELESLLLQKYAHLQPDIQCLKNKEASREAVIQNFREHLGKAQDGDTVFFHFSGHGSREDAPAEFRSIFPDKKHETLVCYDSRFPNGADLADIELAVLLSEISQNKPKLDIIVSLDCCHAGSGSRDADEMRFARARQAEREGNARTLKDYIRIADSAESYYEKNYRENQGKIQIPNTRHILLAACDKKQKAWENLSNQGVYTASLLEVLRASAEPISYADLFRRIRILIHRKADFQDPQLENHGGFDAFASFLEGKTLDNAPQQTIYFKDGYWQMDFGAIHGLNPLIRPEEDIFLTVFPHQAGIHNQVSALGLARVLMIQAQKSILKLNFDPVDTREIYQGVFNYLPLNALRVFLSGEVEGVQALKDLLRTPVARFLEAVNEVVTADYEIKAEQEIYYVIHRLSGKLIQGIQKQELTNEKYPPSMSLSLLEILEHIAQWHQFKKLQNPRPKLNPEDIDFHFYEIDPEGQEHLHTQEEITLDSFLENEKWQPIEYRLEVKNNSPQSLFFQMFFVFNRYGIYWANTKEIASGQSFPLMYQDAAKALIGFHPTLDQENEIELQIKLLISTEALDTHYFELKNLEVGKILYTRFIEAEGVTKEAFVKVQQDWFTKEFRIKIVKNLAQISDRSTSLAEGKIRIEGHHALRAQLSLKILSPQTRNAGETRILQEIPGEEISCLNFAPNPRSTAPESVLELSNIEGDVSSENPLFIHLDTSWNEDEPIIPLAWDGQMIVPVGWATEDEQGKVKLTIETLPAQADEGRRSVGRALKLLFYKVALGRVSKENARLSRLFMDEDGKVALETKNLREKIQKLKDEKPHLRILLMIHGIIGSNRNNFLTLYPVLKGLDYDLVLGFDYENLNTPLQETAENLKTHLREVGLDQFLDKSRIKIDLLAHSMGGLIARKFIEGGSGNQIIHRLIMLGTPNGGSVFGGVPGYIELASKLLILAMNYLNPYVGSAVGLLWILQKNKDLAITATIFKTLSQMDARSSFIQELNNQADPGIPYVLIAGDASLNDSKGILNNIKLGLSKVILESPHDGVVSLKSVESVGSKAEKEALIVASRHTSYFEDPDSLEELRKILANPASETPPA